MDNCRSLIRLSKSSIKGAEKLAVMRILDKEFLGMGEEVRIFEDRLTEFFGRQAVCVVNGTAALHLSLQACGIGFGDEVIVPSITYVASFQAISATGAVPVACDIDEDSLCLNLEDAEKRITSKTKAIMPVHYSGGVGRLGKIYKLAEKNNLRVVEDAAHAFGTTFQNQKIGSFGDIACFSFDGIKNITSGEGGCIVTDDKEVLGLVRDARLLGVEKDSEKRYLGERSWEFNVSRQGWRYHMSDIMAAIGIAQLSRFDEIKNKRRTLSKFYYNELKKIPSIKLIKHNYNEVVPHIFVLILDSDLSRTKVIDLLKDKAISTGIHYLPNHLHSYFKNNTCLDEPLKNVEKISSRIITIPLHEDLSRSEQIYIIKNLEKIVRKI